MPTHRLPYVGRVECSLLDYVNVCLAAAVFAYTAWLGSVLLMAVSGGFALFVVTITLYGTRAMGRIEERREAQSIPTHEHP